MPTLKSRHSHLASPEYRSPGRPITRPDTTGRARAERIYPDTEPCQICGKTGRGRGTIDRHHVDGNRLNNTSSNVHFLCRKHHMAAHQNLDGKVGGGPRPRIYAMQKAQGTERAAKIREMLTSGATIQEAALRINIHVASAYRVLRKYPE